MNTDATHLQALVVQRAHDAPDGLNGTSLAQHAEAAQTVRIDVDHAEVDICDVELIVALGSAYSAYNDRMH